MAKNNLKEFVVDADGGDVIQPSYIPDPVPGEGGDIQPKLADVKQQVDPEAEEIEDITPGNTADVREDVSIDSLFENMDLNEEFKNKISIVFEAAVNERVQEKMESLTEELEEKFSREIKESLEESIEEIIESLDGYLDYIVTEWMNENEVAIETGIKVEMAESLINNLKTVFYEHNIDIDEEKIDVVSSLEEELAEIKAETNETINENIKLNEEIKSLKASLLFNEMTEGLTVSQVERLKVLSENLDTKDLNDYKSHLNLLKESFFKAKPTTKVLTEEVLEDIVETKQQRASLDQSVNYLADAISKISRK